MKLADELKGRYNFIVMDKSTAIIGRKSHNLWNSHLL